MKKVKKKSTENCHFTAVKNGCMLQGRVFVMHTENMTSNNVLVVIFSHFLKLILFAFFAIFDLVHSVKATFHLP